MLFLSVRFSNEIEAVAELLHLPDYVFPVAGLSIGKPAVNMEEKPRLPEKNILVVKFQP